MRLNIRMLALTAVCLSGCGSPTASFESTPIAAFDRVWAAFDRTYPYFDLKSIDWNGARAQYRSQAERTTDVASLNTVLTSMLAPLHDQHVWLEAPDGTRSPTWQPSAKSNFDQAQWLRTVAQNGWQQVRLNLGFARFSGVPYIAIGGWVPSQFTVGDLDALLERARQDPVLIVDVRPNSGGDDQLALAFAARFTDHAVLTEIVRTRNGPAHSDLGNEVRRTLRPRGPWTYRGRVLLLTGRASLSSTESFVAAMRQIATVTVIGDTTGGATANPAPEGYYAGWRVWIPTWFATLPDGSPIEGKGIAPAIYAPFDGTAAQDPIIMTAVALAGARAGPQ